MAFTEDTSRYRIFKLGDLVHYHDKFVIPPDAVNWKFEEPDTSDSMAIIIDQDAVKWDMKPYAKHRMYKIKHLKSGIVRTCSSHNLTKVYISDEVPDNSD
jgi:hypothetical protein|tara:strand:+ start:413 stop:712 length:300 start_codon:yes stop_codon:yes gene_type:complete